MKKPPRNWKDIKCQKILKYCDPCWAVSTKGNHIAVGFPNSVKVFDRSTTDLLLTIEEGQLGGELSGITFQDQEHILVSDTDNNNIKMFTIQGRHVCTIDRGSATFEPSHITISPDGDIHVCDDADNHCVCIFDVNGKFQFSFGPSVSGEECFDCPEDLCFASDGFLYITYITDVGNSGICVYDKDGKFIRKFTTKYQPTCIDATDCGHLIVSSFLSDKVMIYTTGGDLVHIFGEHGSGLGQFDGPIGVSVDSEGLVYIADFSNRRIQVF